MIKVLPIYFIICFFSSVVYLLKLNYGCFLAIHKAGIWNIEELKKTINKRFIIQKKIRKISDQKIFNIVKNNPRTKYYYYLIKGLDNYKD